MKKYFKYFLFIFSILFITIISESCAKKYGCPGEDSSIQTDKDGNLPTKKGKSNLFDKKMRKRSKSY